MWPVILAAADRNVSAGLLEVWVSYLGFNVYSKQVSRNESTLLGVPCCAGASRRCRVHGRRECGVTAPRRSQSAPKLPPLLGCCRKGDLCEAVPCPLAEGQLTLEFKQSLPRSAPPVGVLTRACRPCELRQHAACVSCS